MRRASSITWILLAGFLPLSFGGPHDLQREDIDFFLKIKNLVKTSEKAQIVALVSYPIEIKVGENKRPFENSEELLTHYDLIFTEQLKKALEKQDPEKLFKNWMGVMVGRGEVWFEKIQEPNGNSLVYRIIGINPKAQDSY